jgi:A/G-specific adenine glycosylase
VKSRIATTLTYNAGSLRELDPKSFARTLLRWYGVNRRDLPWRGERNSYRIWISEVMLQQTRAAVVRERYPAFLRQFPGVKKLARARLAEVLAAWSGLGYYRRARALHKAAKIIMRKHRGRLPRRAEQLRGLPGIGRYTAAAVASIAFNEPVALVDGNVERVLTRLYGEPPTDFWASANVLLDRKQPGDFNQAMMELGATVCLPGRPLCDECPVRKFCRLQGALEPRAASSRRRQQASYGVARRDNSVYLVQRSAQSRLMPGMWELPQLEHRPAGDSLLKLRHAITNTDYQVDVFGSESPGDNGRGRWVDIKTAARLPLTGLTRKILQRIASSKGVPNVYFPKFS